jgi:hypothetical protein
MAATMRQNCRVEYHGKAIIINGPLREAQAEAQRIIQQFAGSAVPYRLASAQTDQVILKPV